MKKSYHSNTVPAELAAMTSRISLRAGLMMRRWPAQLLRPLISPNLAGHGPSFGGRRWKAPSRCLPRQQHRPVAPGETARGRDQGEIGPVRQLAFRPPASFRARREWLQSPPDHALRHGAQTPPPPPAPPHKRAMRRPMRAIRPAPSEHDIERQRRAAGRRAGVAVQRGSRAAASPASSTAAASNCGV